MHYFFELAGHQILRQAEIRDVGVFADSPPSWLEDEKDSKSTNRGYKCDQQAELGGFSGCFGHETFVTCYTSTKSCWNNLDN